MNAWEMTESEYDAPWLVHDLSKRDIEILTILREAKARFGEIYPRHEDYKVTKLEFKALVKRKLLDFITNTPAILGLIQLCKANGENPWTGGPLKHHKQVIQDALAAGKPVPAHVLNEYPDLKRATQSRPPGFEPPI